jgi:serine/threonine protein kinase
MSPEQTRGEIAGPPSDVFSLGCVLHEMLTGRHTFARASAAETMAAILRRTCRQLAEPRQAEVQDLHVAVGGDEDVLRLQVAMDDAPGMSGVQPFGDLDAYLDGLPPGEPPCRDAPAQRLSLEQLHHRERDAVGHAEVVDREDVGMREGGDDLGLALEARQRLGVVGEVLREDLDGDVPFETGMPGAVDLSHPTGTHLGQDLVGTEPHAGADRHGGVALVYSSIAARATVRASVDRSRFIAIFGPVL